jgi:hypothetical protein
MSRHNTLSKQTELQRLDGAGTLDAKWTVAGNSHAWLGVASANGCVSIRHLLTDALEFDQHHAINGTPFGDTPEVLVALDDSVDDMIALSLDWSNKRSPSYVASTRAQGVWRPRH